MFWRECSEEARLEGATWLAREMQEKRSRAKVCEQSLDPAKHKEMHSSLNLQKGIQPSPPINIRSVRCESDY